MSVCVVAQFPWSAIRAVTQAEPPGAIVCSDTRITTGQRALPWFCSKQEPIGRNIVACYTSSNAAATILGLQKVRHDWSLKRIGESLRDAHDRSGGMTELIAVVWRRARVPQVLELMPPHYRPRARRGIIGIGDAGVLRWFRQNFVEGPPPELLARLPADALASLARAVGRPIELPPVTYPIEHAALGVCAAFSEAIRVAGGPTVALPVQTMTISRGEARALTIGSTADLQNWEEVTVRREHVRLPVPRPIRTSRYTGPRTAVQLLT